MQSLPHWKFRIFVIILFLLFTLQLAQAQQPLNSNAISKTTFDSLVRKGFNQMASGQNDAPSLSNYAAFSPTEGKFTFNGFVNVSKRVAVSMSAAGGLLDENVGSLFEGGKENNNTDLSLKLHFRIDTPSIEFNYRDFFTYCIKRDALLNEKKLKRDAMMRALDQLDYTITDLNSKNSYADSVIQHLKTDSINFFNGVFLAASKCDTAFHKCRKMYTDSLLSVVKSLGNEYSGIIKRKATLDSLTKVKAVDRISKARAQQKPTTLSRQEQLLAGTYSLGKTSLRDSLQIALDYEYAKKFAALEYTIPIPAWNARWITLVANWNRKAYRTYDGDLAFADQIQKQDFNAFNFGLEFNNFHFDKRFHRASFLNIGLVRKENINLEDLTTSKVTDTDTSTMSGVTREAITEYTVYTDSIEQYKMWNLYANYYLVLGKKMSNGIHLGINAEFRDNDDNVFDATLGYFFGFNNKTDKRLVNTEVFVRFNDLTDEVDIDDVSFFKQTQVGLSIAIPILTIK
jgi:hypothetical protein